MPSSIEAFFLLTLLLPGLVGLGAFEIAAERRPKEVLDRIVLAICFTLLGGFVTTYLFGYPSHLEFDQNASKDVSRILDYLFTKIVLANVLVCILLGVTFAFVSNKDFHYKVLKLLHITKRTGSIDVWHEVFKNIRGRWVRIRFTDGTILIGWPKYHSESGEQKELFLAEATWHFEKDGATRSIDVAGPGVLIGKLEGIRAIELID